MVKDGNVSQMGQNKNDKCQSCSASMSMNLAMDREEIYVRLREKGFRLTEQRKAIIDVILSENCTCCKELYYCVTKKMPEIGLATAYRMVSVLEEVGAVKREGSFKVCAINPPGEKWELVLDSGRVITLEDATLKKVIESGLRNEGFINDEKVITFQEHKEK